MKNILVLALALITVTSLAGTNFVANSSMEQRTGGLITKPLAENEKVILIVDGRNKADGLMADLQKQIASKLHIATVVGKQADNAAIKLIVVDEGDTLVNIEKQEAIFACGKDAEETASKMFAALLAIFSGKGHILTREGLALTQTAIQADNLGRIRRATYKQACLEGWAPAPTNDYQKAIFDSFKGHGAAK